MPTTPDPRRPRRHLGSGPAAAEPSRVAPEPEVPAGAGGVSAAPSGTGTGAEPGPPVAVTEVPADAGGAGEPPSAGSVGGGPGVPEPSPWMRPETRAPDAAATAVVRAPRSAAEGEPSAAATGPAPPAGGEAREAAGPAEPGESPESAEPRGPGEAAESPQSSGSPESPRSPESPDSAEGNRFTVRLANFEGPFDLLLQLISKHKLDVTEVALSKVTNEFMAYIQAMGPDWDLDQTTEFLVVAATLLDLKAARLLPAAEVEDEADLALLEARDLLFARLLQYRAYKRIAAIFAERLENETLRHPRTVGLEPHHAELLPEVVLSVGPERFARLAVKAMQPKPKPQVYVDHIHAPLVSVREQAEHVIALLSELGEASFRQLTADAADTLTVVARFLALLELYREKAVALDQEEALGVLRVRWTGAAAGSAVPLVTDEFDQEAAQTEQTAGTKQAGGTKQAAKAASGPGPADPDPDRSTNRAATPGTDRATGPGTKGEQR